MLNELIDKRKVTISGSEDHKNKRNEYNAQASQFARERNTLNNQTRECVEEAQKHKELRDQFNKEVQDLKDKRNELNEQANVLFGDIDAFKKEHGGIKSRSIKELHKQIEHLEFRQQAEYLLLKKNVNSLKESSLLRTTS